MAISPPDLIRAAAAPLTSRGGMRIHAASSSPAQITLAAGSYEVLNDGDFMVYLRLGAAVSVPGDGDPEVSGQGPVPAGGKAEIALDAETVVHSLALGSTQLVLVRKAAV